MEKSSFPGKQKAVGPVHLYISTRQKGNHQAGADIRTGLFECGGLPNFD